MNSAFQRPKAFIPCPCQMSELDEISSLNPSTLNIKLFKELHKFGETGPIQC